MQQTGGAKQLGSGSSSAVRPLLWQAGPLALALPSLPNPVAPRAVTSSRRARPPTIRSSNACTQVEIRKLTCLAGHTNFARATSQWLELHKCVFLHYTKCMSEPVSMALAVNSQR